MHVGEPRIVREFVRSEQQAQQQVEQAGIVSVSVGIRHTACVSAGGELYTFGHNMCGQLGHGDRKESSLPRLVHVTSSGDGGGGADGQQQRGAEPLRGVVAVSCGGYHTIATTRTIRVAAAGGGRRAGEVEEAHWCWGYGEEGQLGLSEPPVHAVLQPRRLPELVQ